LVENRKEKTTEKKEGGKQACKKSRRAPRGPREGKLRTRGGGEVRGQKKWAQEHFFGEGGRAARRLREEKKTASKTSAIIEG